MNDITATLRECHRIVWEARKELEPFWPTPTTKDALLFAFTELGEAVDAHLRSKPQYARNRDKDLDVLDELADCAMMLLTMFQDGERTPFESGVGGWKLPLLGYFMGLLLHDWENTHRFSFEVRRGASTILTGIATYPGMDLPARLAARLERIKAKRLEVTP